MNYLSIDSLGVEPGHNLAVEDLFLLLLARDIHSSFLIVRRELKL